MNHVLIVLLVGGGLALTLVGLLQRGRDREVDLAAILELPYGERDVPVEAVTERSLPGVVGATRLADRAVRRVDGDGALGAALATAHIPLRPGEYVLAAGAAVVVLGTGLAVVTANPFTGVLAGLLAVYVATIAPRVAASRRRRQVETQLPDALATIAASLEAGHTFLRAIQMYADEAMPPLAEELGQVVHETTLGDPVLESLERMADRLRIRDLDWVVQAIRIQQSTGGRLADVLHTLAEFMRAREDVRREVKVLTAEGRMSAAVLGAMPPLLFVAFQVLNPGYVDPLLRGWGLVVLAGAVTSTVVGVSLIVRMVKIEV
jgi:tight adherence protein B